jgi:hypothetical protein
MPTAAEIRRRKKQDATRKRVAIWLTSETAVALDAARGKKPRSVFVTWLIERQNKPPTKR